MKSIDIKEELRTLIEKENDLQLLEDIKYLLEKSGFDPALKNKLTARALKSEIDIKEGRTFSIDEFKDKLNDRFGG
ncbi:hypothetical protein [Algoriphagus hitonicola]|uniref:Addiction module component n=1 Tax=Algoriphagus hitonicola TaxID=435880 RepID=A0A1I2T3H1_9BACT|nr:hypothetical protein [Algoriphagus hitonicola]SFG59645.1 hypothetical protein SAMN04487988_105203 [Algoriphagus hitonicola]